MSANVRTSLLILFPVFFWFVTGVFQDEDKGAHIRNSPIQGYGFNRVEGVGIPTRTR